MLIVLILHKTAYKKDLHICAGPWRHQSDLNRRITVLQTVALPLGYGAIWRRRRGSNPRADSSPT